uniref:UBC core domain-containing protein n=1 Tax=Clytia hemisphaerica TaxID=252671 RepID=A0A7M5VC21_9CNID|eukprot:TCONS_00061105-protein
MGDLAKKYNLKSPAVKRLMREAAELSEPTDQYFAQPLDDNLFEWHFTVRGPPDTEFDDGRYHGRITLPPEYPMKPPSIILLTPNGRFEIGKKICLSMSAHHPETWQPSWSIRTVLLALIGFMPTPGGGAIGALDHTPEERKVMAKRSKTWTCEACGSNNEASLLERDPTKEKEETEEVKELASQINFKGEDKSKQSAATPTQSQTTTTTSQSAINNSQQQAAAAQMSQMYANYNQFYGMQQQQQNPMFANQQFQQPSQQQTPSSQPTTTETTTTQSSAQPNTGSTETTTNENTDTTNLRQRRQGADSSRSSSPATTPTPTHNQTQGQSKLETVSFYMLWIVLVPLVLLILRRLGMENSGMGKH